jgi:TolA-binding protein
MKLQDLQVDLLAEMLPMTTINPQPITPNPNEPQQSPQAQMAQHQKDATARRKQIQDQINLLNRQIADLKKQLTSIA